MADLRSSVIELCAEIGRDPLLVQGAGGNCSWKDDATLWVKASGTWLADAATRDIFVPVDLHALQCAIDAENFSVKPEPTIDSALKPSIETLLHALMPQTVVVHLHAIDILAHLVRSDGETILRAQLGNCLRWGIVDYHKPGAELAAAIKRVLDREPAARVVFMKNHGVVMGGADIGEIRHLLATLIERLAPASHSLAAAPFASAAPVPGYAAIADESLHQLATDAQLFARLATAWALYPDHVVFLGPRAHRYDSFAELARSAAAGDRPDLAFVRNEGVFVSSTFSSSQIAQLRCYYDLLIRQPHDAPLCPLTAADVADLLSRDDEQHRLLLAKK